MFSKCASMLTKMDSEEEIIIASDTAVINYFLCVVSIK